MFYKNGNNTNKLKNKQPLNFDYIEIQYKN